MPVLRKYRNKTEQFYKHDLIDYFMDRSSRDIAEIASRESESASCDDSLFIKRSSALV